MPEGSGIGLYPYGEVGDASENNEVSSTYEGRHLTFVESEITGHEHAFPTKGHPVVVGEDIVGVVLAIKRADGTVGAAANSVNDYITIDTEGIWLQSVVALNPAAVAVVAGDELFIDKTSGIISNNMNKNTHTHFGYALGGVTAGNTAIISVKVHWDPDDASEEMVGVTDIPYVNDEASKLFRGFFYEATGGGTIEGERMELTISTTAAVTACVDYRELTLPGDAKNPTGRSSVIEARLNVGAGASTLATMANLVLDWFNESTNSINNYACAYICLRERSTVSTRNMPRLFHFMDEAATIPDAGVDDDRIFVDSASDQVSNVRIRCGYGPNATPFWILCTDQPPT